MQQITCPHCGKNLDNQAGAAFCPFCGGAVEAPVPQGGEPQAVLDVLEETKSAKDLYQKWERLQAVLEKYPESLALNQELLFLGRLYLRGRLKNLDFSIIKCHLLKLYLKPEEFSQKVRAEMREELFAHPLLTKCEALSGNPEAFLRKYLLQLENEFIDLFLRGDSTYMRRFFGFGMDSKAPKTLADPVCYMMVNIRKDMDLTSQQREVLSQTLYQAFAKNMAGETKWLDENLQKVGLAIPGHP